VVIGSHLCDEVEEGCTLSCIVSVQEPAATIEEQASIRVAAPINDASNVRFREQEQKNYYRRISGAFGLSRTGSLVNVASHASENASHVAELFQLSSSVPPAESATTLDSSVPLPQFNGVPFEHAHAMYLEQ
jgi:hypothetical protein